MNIDKHTPYYDPIRSKCANFWFSCSFAPNQHVFSYLLSKKNIDSLSKSNGTSIVYTHFGYFYKNGKLDNQFVESINYLRSKKNGIYIPVSKLLDEIALKRRLNGKVSYPKINILTKFKYEFLHLLTRVFFRKFHKIDDYAFKKLNKEMFINK